jgi:hypothetical protein
MHGQYIRCTDGQLIIEADTFQWLLRRYLKAESESEIIAAQFQVLQTKFHTTMILGTETDSKCRLCPQYYEIIHHMTSACAILATEQYTVIKQHCTACAELHLNICYKTEVKLDKEHWHEHVPKLVITRPQQ